MEIMRAHLALLAIASVAGLSAQTFRAAVAKADITPSGPQWLLGYGARQSTGVHDRIHHRVLVLDDGRTSFVLASTELCLVSPAFYDELAAELQQETGIDRLHFWWTFTHTHSAPETGPPGLARAFMPERYKHGYDQDYARLVKSSLIQAVKEARAKLIPARLSTAVGKSSANINRRARTPDGQILLGMNPDGPVDRQLGLMKLTGSDGALIAVIANYAIHGTVLGAENLLISGDAPGIVAAYVEQKLGAPLLFINGAAGDIAPIYSTQSLRGSHLAEFSVLLGDRILAGTRTMDAGTTDVRLQAGEKIIETPLSKGFAWEEPLRSYLHTADAGSSRIRLPIRFLKLTGNLAIWAAPLELFCEISTEVRNRSPFQHTFYFGYANGWLGYLPTKRAFAEGGYEIKTSPYTEQAEEDVLQAVTTHFQGLSR
jgi:neutral ceramidase